MTLKRVCGPYNILKLRQDMVYGPSYVVHLVHNSTRAPQNHFPVRGSSMSMNAIQGTDQPKGLRHRYIAYKEANTCKQRYIEVYLFIYSYIVHMHTYMNRLVLTYMCIAHTLCCCFFLQLGLIGWLRHDLRLHAQQNPARLGEYHTTKIPEGLVYKVMQY